MKFDGRMTAVGAVEVVERVAVAKGVVAERDHVGPHREEVGARLLGDAESAGRVLAVDDHEVGHVALAQSRHRPAQAGATGTTDDVADEEHLHSDNVLRVAFAK